MCLKLYTKESVSGLGNEVTDLSSSRTMKGQREEFGHTLRAMGIHQSTPDFK